MVKILYALSLVCYPASFLLLSVKTRVLQADYRLYGYQSFLGCFSGLWQGGVYLFAIWLANPAFWAGAILFAAGKVRAARCAAITAALFAALALVYLEFTWVGYYVWVASIGLLIAASHCSLASRRLNHAY